MTIDRAIEIFDPECPENVKSGQELEEAMYLAVKALKLLKTQEPAKPRKIPPCITRPLGGDVCGYCGIRWLEKNDYYCPNCGREVNWDA